MIFILFVISVKNEKCLKNILSRCALPLSSHYETINIYKVFLFILSDESENINNTFFVGKFH